jgi:hypothetical protein
MLEVVGTLFCLDSNDGTKVMCRYLDQFDKSFLAFSVATNDGGYLMRTHLQKSRRLALVITSQLGVEENYLIGWLYHDNSFIKED